MTPHALSAAKSNVGAILILILILLVLAGSAYDSYKVWFSHKLKPKKGKRSKVAPPKMKADTEFQLNVPVKPRDNPNNIRLVSSRAKNNEGGPST